MSVDAVLFAILACWIAGSAVAVVVTRDIVRSAFWLLLALIGVSLLYFLLAAEFVGAVQLIVYVGGTMVLVVFGIMLTARTEFLRIVTQRREWVIGGLLSLLLFGLLVKVSIDAGMVRSNPPMNEMPNTGAIGSAFLSKYLLPFEIVSVHLLVVLIAAAYLARAKRRAGGPST